MDYRRQSGLINPEDIKDKSIVIIGAGATGSEIALTLAQLGWGDSTSGQGKLTVYDFDKVEEHNLCNQVYNKTHVGMNKVDALKKVIIDKCGFEINAICMEVKDSPIDANYVFILTDTMESRKVIFEKCLRFSFNIDMVIETRMGLKNGRIYAFNPSAPDEVEAWKATLYSDEEATVSPCGASASIITTVKVLASLAATNVVQHFNQKYSLESPEKIKDTEIWNELQFSLYPFSCYAKQFKKGTEPQMLQQGL